MIPILLLILGLLGAVMALWSRLGGIKPADPGPGLQLLQGQIDTLRSELGRSLNETQSRMTERLDAISERVETKLGQSAEGMNRQLNEVSGLIDKRLGEGSRAAQETARSTHERLDRAAMAVREVSERLAKLGEASARIFEVGQGLRELQQILGSPKMRGGLGEYLLEDMLATVLPRESFAVQYGFRSGEKVDAAIFLSEGILCVDAKFPLENFRRMSELDGEERRKVRKSFHRDVKLRIDEISKRYINPEEGTLDFAFMYLPAENVYYEAVLAPDSDAADLADYAFRQRRVIPVSPNSFYAYLQVVLAGIRGLKVEENAKRILASLDQLGGELGKVREDFDKLGKHLNNALSSHAGVTGRLDRFERTLQAHRSEKREE